MSTFLQFALASSIPCFSASSCALEVRQKTTTHPNVLIVLFIHALTTHRHMTQNDLHLIRKLLEKSAKPNKYYCSVFCFFMQNCQFMSLHLSFHYASKLVFLHCLTVMFNFILHDKRKGPIWNIIMWTSLFLGQGVIICLYSHEWYAQRYCPLKEVICCKALLFLNVFWSLWLECNSSFS